MGTQGKKGTQSKGGPRASDAVSQTPGAGRDSRSGHDFSEHNAGAHPPPPFLCLHFSPIVWEQVAPRHVTTEGFRHMG